jgi:uncharacterized PurR-regulated membrane protein YhhQ (DUF165 family)
MARATSIKWSSERITVTFIVAALVVIVSSMLLHAVLHKNRDSGFEQGARITSYVTLTFSASALAFLLYDMWNSGPGRINDRRRGTS